MRARGPDMGPASPAARGQGRRRGPPPLRLLLPLSLLLLRAQLAVGNLAGGSLSAAEVRSGRVRGMGKGRGSASGPGRRTATIVLLARWPAPRDPNCRFS